MFTQMMSSANFPLSPPHVYLPQCPTHLTETTQLEGSPSPDLITWKKEYLPSSQDETPKHQPFVFHWAPAPLSFFPGGPPIPET